MNGLCGEAPGHNTRMPVMVVEQAGCAAGAFWESQGPCVVEGACVTIPYERPNEYCELSVAVAGTLRTSWFETESCCDKLVVDGAAYSGPVGPSGNILSPGSTLLWRTDFTVPSSGWTVCLDSGVSCCLSEPAQAAVFKCIE
jgi:hypothetical protein